MSLTLILRNIFKILRNVSVKLQMQYNVVMQKLVVSPTIIYRTDSSWPQNLFWERKETHLPLYEESVKSRHYVTTKVNLTYISQTLHKVKINYHLRKLNDDRTFCPRTNSFYRDLIHNIFFFLIKRNDNSMIRNVRYL